MHLGYFPGSWNGVGAGCEKRNVDFFNSRKRRRERYTPATSLRLAGSDVDGSRRPSGARYEFAQSGF